MVTIDRYGKLGIGIITPTEELHVNGKAKAEELVLLNNATTVDAIAVGESRMGIDANLVPWIKDSTGKIKQLLGNRYNTAGIMANYTLDIENDNVIMCMGTTDITITIPDTNAIPNDGIFREFFIFNLSSNGSKVNIETTGGQTFIQSGLTSISLNANELYNFGAGHPNMGDGLATTTTRNSYIQTRYNGSWSAASFTSATPVPFNTTDLEWDANIIEHDNSNVSRLNFKVGGIAEISYWFGIDSTGGSTYTMQGYLRKNGTTIIDGSSMPTGNYGGEDQSISIGVLYVPVVAGDYIELVLQNTNLTGVVNNIVVSAKMGV